MSKKTRYSVAFIEQALSKVFQRGGRTIDLVSGHPQNVLTS